MVDADRLKASWSRVADFGDQVPLRFYSRLFVTHPETRELFPLSMAAQRDRLVSALGHTITNVDDLEALTPFLQELGRDHRKFGALAAHYEPVGQALLETMADFLGDDWTPELAQDWTDAYGLVAKVMTEAADEAAAHTPPWWDAEVVSHERRTFDIAVLTLQPTAEYDFVPGQSVAVETSLRPRLWRYYSPANAIRPDGSVELHIRRTPGGQVSSALVDNIAKGDILRLGAPIGQRLTLQPTENRNLLFLAGGTGLAPLKALVEVVVAANAEQVAGRERHVVLFVGSRTERELYDLHHLHSLTTEHAWLHVVPTVEEAAMTRYEQGTAVEVALRLGRWQDYAIFVCGSDQMVAGSVDQLTQAGYETDQIYYEGLQGLGGDTYGLIDLGEQR